MYNLIEKRWKALRQLYPGMLGVHRKLKIYGRIDGPSELRYIAKGHYVKFRVLFKAEETDVVSGNRSCAKYMPVEHKEWTKVQGK